MRARRRIPPCSRCSSLDRRQGLPHNPRVTETPVPISSDSVPEDAHAWLCADAAVWARHRPANWARPPWSILALLGTVAVAIAVEPEPACSDAVPCGTDWVGMVQLGLALGLLYWYARLPELTLVAAPALAALVIWEELPNSGWTSRAANVAVLVALALGWASTWARLGARRKQRQLVEGTVGIRNQLPESVGSPGRGVFPIAAGTVLCAVAVGAIVLGLRAVHTDEQHASRAVRTTAEVLSRNDVSLRVRTGDERRIAVEAVQRHVLRLVDRRATDLGASLHQVARDLGLDRKSTRLNSSHVD